MAKKIKDGQGSKPDPEKKDQAAPAQPKPFWRDENWWRDGSLTNKIAAAALAFVILSALVAGGYKVWADWSEAQRQQAEQARINQAEKVRLAAEHKRLAAEQAQYRAANRPNLVFDGLPELLGPISCDMKAAKAVARTSWSYKNVGNRHAVKATTPIAMLRVTPADEPYKPQIPSETCSRIDQRELNPEFPKYLITSIAPQDKRTLIINAVGKFKPIQQGESIRFSIAGCLAYVDEYGLAHLTCRTYGLVGADGRETFTCDGKSFGEFRDAISGHCAD